MKTPLVALTLLAACGADTPQEQEQDTFDSAAEEPCGPAAPTGLSVGECAPDFTLPDSTGAAFSLHAQRGKVALVDISAIW